MQVFIQLTTPVERKDTSEEDSESYEESRRRYLQIRFPKFLSVSNIRHKNIPNQFPQNDLFDYYREESRNNRDIQEEDLLVEEQEPELNLQEEDNGEQNSPVEEEEAEVQQNQRQYLDTYSNQTRY